jgi:hypothetical protein
VCVLDGQVVVQSQNGTQTLSVDAAIDMMVHHLRFKLRKGGMLC